MVDTSADLVSKFQTSPMVRVYHTGFLQKDYKFKASLGYRMSSGPVWAILADNVLKYKLRKGEHWGHSLVTKRSP